MPEPQESPKESVESMAFQLLLQKVTGLENALRSMPPLLKKIIDHLEAQAKQPEAPVATYAQLYPEIDDDEEPEAAPVPPPDPQTLTRARRFWHWFVTERPYD
jgi:hypothetical protein